MEETRLSILIVAATGEFGTHITRQCLKLPNLLVNVLVRNPDKCKELMDEVKNAGGKVIQGDMTKPESLTDCTKGIHTVVSCVVGDFKTVVDGQTCLLEDALKNGVKRFVPSDYSLDVWGIPKGEHYFTDQRLIFREKIDKSPMKALHCTVGFFMEAFLFFNHKNFVYWEDPDTKIDLTPQEDAARYIAAAISRPDRVGDLKIVSDVRPFSEYREIYNRLSGKNVEMVKGGTIADLRKKVIESKEKGDMSTAIGLGYALFCWDGRAKIKERMNDEFPEVKPYSFEDFLKKYGTDIKYDFFVGTLPKSAEEEMKMYEWGPKPCFYACT